MNLFAEIKSLVLDNLNTLVAEGTLPAGLNFSNVTVEPPRDVLHGDMATNAAMVLAKPAKMKPRDIAELLAAKLISDPRVQTADVAGPGFLNLRLDPELWFGIVTVVGAEIGLLTPPLGLSVFAIKSVINDPTISLADIFIGTFPFAVTMLIVLIAVIAFPVLSLALI